MPDPSQIGPEGFFYKLLAPVLTIILGGISGIVGVKLKVSWLEKSVEALNKNARFEVTCDKIHKAVNRELSEIKKSQHDMQQDLTIAMQGISTLLERTKHL